MQEYMIEIYTDKDEKSILVHEKDGYLYIHKAGLYKLFSWLLEKRIKKIIIIKCNKSICHKEIHKWEKPT